MKEVSIRCGKGVCIFYDRTSQSKCYIYILIGACVLYQMNNVEKQSIIAEKDQKKKTTGGSRWVK